VIKEKALTKQGWKSCYIRTLGSIVFEILRDRCQYHNMNRIEKYRYSYILAHTYPAIAREPGIQPTWSSYIVAFA